MLKIRLKRIGYKNKPLYLLVIAKNLMKRSRSLCTIGTYNPITKQFIYNKELFYTYLNNGAYPTTTVRHLIKNNLLSM